jgi:SAM-dependent methyltransferase
MKDKFSDNAYRYARYRPGYPNDLFEFIMAQVTEKDLAWDCGTGSGQTAINLASLFKNVYASDISAAQIANAVSAENISYCIEPAEKSSLLTNSVDLVTISQALHWFDHHAFYEEVKRVSKKNGIIAAWTYSLWQVNAEVDDILHNYHFNTLKSYWDPEREHVDNGYANLPFPFKRINTPTFTISLQWSLNDLKGYLNTWSAIKKFQSINKYNPVDQVIENISRIWPAPETRSITFPLHLLIGYVH